MGPVVRASDRLWWWRTIRRSGLVDAGFYAAQLGWRRMPADLAILHYVGWGFRRGRSINPLFDEVHAGGGLPEVFRVPAMYAYLVSDRPTVQVHPWWDAVAHARASDSPERGALEAVWDRPDTTILLAAGAQERRVTVAALRAEALMAARGWRGHRRSGAAAPGTAERTLVRVIQRRDRGYARKAAQAARFSLSGGAAASIEMVDPDASQWVSAALLVSLHPGLRLRRHGRRARWSDVLRAAAGIGGGTIAVLDPRGDVNDTEVDLLVARAEEGRAAIPVHRHENGTLVGIGAAATPGARRPTRILGDHPYEDASRLGGRVEVPLLTGRSVAMPGEALRAALAATGRSDDLEALSPAIRDLIPFEALIDIAPVLDEPEVAFSSGRPADAASPSRRDDRPAAEELHSRAGFTTVRWGAGRDGSAEPVLRWERPHPTAQRWAIKICSPAGRRGEVWGDTHFAHGLAAALRRRGHEVVIDAFGASRRPTAYLDDVNVVIRGPYRIDPPDTGVNLEWIISHPDEIGREEISRFDRVFAASEPWSASASARWGMPVEPLLECADVDKFHPRSLPRGDDIVFVGTARGIARPSVVAPIAAGIDVKVYGPDWRPFLPASAITAESIPNDELPARYETASVVLNDQWPAMRREGFIAMRPFDVVAVGGRVISEQVHGIEELFDGAVVTYRDAAHLVELLRTDPAELFPGPERLAEIAAVIRRDHSFDARAGVLHERAATARARNSS